jgi:hypothetical protein
MGDIERELANTQRMLAASEESRETFSQVRMAQGQGKVSVVSLVCCVCCGAGGL